MASQPEPNTPYIDMGKDLPKQKMPAATLKLVEKGWDIKTRMDALNAELKEINGKLIEKHQECSLVVPGVCRCPIAASVTVGINDDSPENVEGLKAIFGKELKKYLPRKVSFVPTTALKAIAKDPTHALYRKVCKFLQIKVSDYGIRWSTAK